MSTAGARLRGGIVAAILLIGVSRRSHAQDQTVQLRAQQDTLEQLRQEREELERRAGQLASTMHDLSEELDNLDQQREATASIVHRLDAQLTVLSQAADSANARVAGSQAELTARREALQRRLVDIYKRGPMQTTQAMLSARSFGELVARYKYLHLLALHDRALVHRVEELRTRLERDRARVVTLRNALARNRGDKADEEARLASLEQERTLALTRTKRQARMIEDRIAQLKTTEAQLNATIASLDEVRVRDETAHPAAVHVGSSIRASEYGQLDWPVEGPLVYSFGKTQAVNNTTIRWNGVGIRSLLNTPVKVVADGRVVNVGSLGTYGLTVIVDHGGGDYSIYGSLATASVRAGQVVTHGQAIGTVGVSDPDLPPHLHFEIRHAGEDGRPASVDPADWLKGMSR